MAITSADIKKALLVHYAPPSHRVFFEVAADTGMKANRHIDALACGIWPSVGHEIAGIEIKVSRSDWKREMADPAKAQELMRFCNRWWLACPDGLITADEVPATWGILYLKEGGGLRVKKQAPALTPDPITRGFMMAVVRQANGVDMELVGSLVEERHTRAMQDFDKRVESAAAQRVQRNSQNTESAIKIAQTVLELTGEDIRSHNMDPKAFAAAYLLMRDGGLIQHLGEGWGGLARAHHNITQALEVVAALHAHPSLDEIRKLVNPPRKGR